MSVQYFPCWLRTNFCLIDRAVAALALATLSFATLDTFVCVTRLRTTFAVACNCLCCAALVLAFHGILVRTGAVDTVALETVAVTGHVCFETLATVEAAQRFRETCSTGFGTVATREAARCCQLIRSVDTSLETVEAA